MNELPISPDTLKKICLYFNGDDEKSLYGYRTGSALVNMYTSRFGTPDIEAGPSRWTLCYDTITFLYETGRVNEFFTTMLSVRNISKELQESNQTICATKRKEAIGILNNILLADDMELIDIANSLVLHHIEDETDLIGSGGFARVYRVPGTDRVVKKLKDEFKDNAGIVSRFKNEFYLISDKLEGINGIIKSFDYDADDISYTMEYCSADLKKYISSTSLDENERICLILEILEIMKQVHDRKVLHRDLSPKNIFIKEKHPVIADFGLGKAIDENGRTYMTIDTSCNGTLEYCDPRQFQGLGFADEQSDIYSLGRIINYVMTNDSDNFKHALSIVSTIATESSLDARFHNVQEMVGKIEHLTKNHKDNEYISRCEQLLSSGYYDKSMDDYLLSFGDDELIGKLNLAKFRNVYSKVISNISYNTVLIERFSGLLNIFNSPIGHTFASFDDVSYFCVDTLRNHRGISPALKTVLGECIYAIAIGVNRWNAQSYFEKNYRYLESDYVQETMNEMSKIKK